MVDPSIGCRMAAMSRNHYKALRRSRLDNEGRTSLYGVALPIQGYVSDYIASRSPLECGH
jgi:hypothetical protein